MKYTFLATGVFLTTLSAIAAILMFESPKFGNDFELVAKSCFVLALVCFGFYQMERIEETM